MGRPNLIFLENHFDKSCKAFLINHLHLLKQMGYQTVMFESGFESVSKLRQLNEMSLSVLTQNSDMAKTLYGLPPHFPTQTLIENTRSFIRLIDAVHSLNMDAQCIDPQKISPSDLPRIMGTTALVTPEIQARDAIMVQRIMSEASKQKGGVIFIVGAAHRTLFQHLEESTLGIVMADKNLRDAKYVDEGEFWMNMQYSEKRNLFYRRPVHYFDDQPTFSQFDLVCQLSAKLDLSNHLVECDTIPEIGNRLNQTTHLPFNYKADEYHILHGQLTGEEEILKALQKGLAYHMPNLPTFFRMSNGKSELVIKGLNLPEHQATLTRFFNL